MRAGSLKEPGRRGLLSRRLQPCSELATNTSQKGCAGIKRTATARRLCGIELQWCKWCSLRALNFSRRRETASAPVYRSSTGEEPCTAGRPQDYLHINKNTGREKKSPWKCLSGILDREHRYLRVVCLLTKIKNKGIINRVPALNSEQNRGKRENAAWNLTYFMLRFSRD